MMTDDIVSGALDSKQSHQGTVAEDVKIIYTLSNIIQICLNFKVVDFSELMNRCQKTEFFHDCNL